MRIQILILGFKELKNVLSYTFSDSYKGGLTFVNTWCKCIGQARIQDFEMGGEFL